MESGISGYILYCSKCEGISVSMAFGNSFSSHCILPAHLLHISYFDTGSRDSKDSMGDHADDDQVSIYCFAYRTENIFCFWKLSKEITSHVHERDLKMEFVH